MLGGTRTPLSGMGSRHTHADCLHPTLFCEIKHRKKIPFLKTFYETLELAKAEKKIPVIVIHELGRRHDIMMLELEDFCRLTGCSKRRDSK